jgi:WD40 repeat protein
MARGDLATAGLALVEAGDADMTMARVGLILLFALGYAGGIGMCASPLQGEKQAEAKQTTPTDLFGDPLPAGAIARLGTLRFRHGFFLRDVLISPDGRTLISAGGDVNIWDAQSGRRQRQFSFTPSYALGINLSPDGKLLAVSQQGRSKMRFWDPTSGTEIFPFGDSPPQALRTVLSPNGDLLATLDAQSPPAVTIWDVRKGKKIRTIDRGVAFVWTVHTLAFSPNGQLLAIPSETGVRIWDLAAGKELYALDLGTKTTGGCVVFSADGKRLAAASFPTPTGADHAIHLWDMTIGKKLGVLKGHEKYITALAMSPKDNLLASAGMDGRIRFWDLVKQREIGQSAGPLRDYNALHFSADGNMLVSGEYYGVLRLWNPHTHKELPATAARGDSPRWVSFAPDGQTLITTQREQIGHWDPLTGRPRRILYSQSLEPYQPTLSPDGKALATLDRTGGQVLLWDVATGKLVRRIGEGGQPGLVSSCAFSPDGRRLAGGSNVEDIIRIWDVASGKEIKQLKGQKKTDSLAFTPDGGTLVSASDGSRGDYTVRLWKLATGAEIWQKVTRPWTASDLAFSPDGRTLALVGGLPGQLHTAGEVRLWDAVTGKELKHFEGHREPVRCVAFSVDGRMLATGSLDNMIRLWEIATGKERQCLQGHQNWISAVSFSPNGRLLVTASLDTTALVWDLTGCFRDRRFQTRHLSAEELNRCWNDLAHPDAARAYRSIRVLVGSPKETVAFLKNHLSPVTAADPKRVKPLLAALDSDQFAERDKAMTELEQLGLSVEPALRKALSAKPSLEVRQRIEAILDKLAGGPRWRVLRALEVLEHIATPEARQFLEKLSQGTAELWPTQEAKASLVRLKARPVVHP